MAGLPQFLRLSKTIAGVFFIFLTQVIMEILRLNVGVNINFKAVCEITGLGSVRTVWSRLTGFGGK
jgi:hypothetical protein